MFKDERHDVRVVVFEDAEVGVETCKLVREIRELSYLEELFSL